jgi:hypothetical protein
MEHTGGALAQLKSIGGKLKDIGGTLTSREYIYRKLQLKQQEEETLERQNIIKALTGIFQNIKDNSGDSLDRLDFDSNNICCEALSLDALDDHPISSVVHESFFKPMTREEMNRHPMDLTDANTKDASEGIGAVWDYHDYGHQRHYPSGGQIFDRHADAQDIGNTLNSLFNELKFKGMDGPSRKMIKFTDWKET